MLVLGRSFVFRGWWWGGAPPGHWPAPWGWYTHGHTVMCLPFGERGPTSASQALCWHMLIFKVKPRRKCNDVLCKKMVILQHSGCNVLTDLFFLPTCQNSSLRIHIKLILVHQERLLPWVLGGKASLGCWWQSLHTQNQYPQNGGEPNQRRTPRTTN